MKKRYLRTVEDVLDLKDTETKIYSDDENDDFYYKFVNGYFCRFDDCGSARFNDTILLTKDEDDERYYILEEEPMQEVTEKDIGKLCRFWTIDYKDAELGILEEISYDCDEVRYMSKEEYWYDHCRRLSPSDVAELTGYKVEEK